MKNSAGIPNTNYNYQYQYDGDSNRTAQVANGVTTQYTYNAANEITAAGGTTYTYDADGNQTSPTTALGSANGTAGTYNAENQLSVETPPGSTPGSQGTPIPQQYVGSGNADRISSGSTTFTAAPSPAANAAIAQGPDPQSMDPFTGGDSTSQAAPPQVDESQSSSGTWFYIHDPAGGLIDELQSTGSGHTPYYYITDGQGSVVGVTDSTGSLVNSYTYDPYGQPSPGATNKVANPWLYDGGYYDNSAGYYHFGDRYYDPSTGRFTQLDAITDWTTTTGLNRYAYARQDPITESDPSGLYAPQDGSGVNYAPYCQPMILMRDHHRVRFCIMVGRSWANFTNNWPGNWDRSGSPDPGHYR
jgi:RHS repeat-associated protein